MARLTLSRRVQALTKPRSQPKSILKKNNDQNFKRSDLQLRFKDQCKSSHPHLSLFSKDSS